LVQVNVNSANVDGPLRTLKRKLAREGVFRAIKLKRHYETPSEKKKRKTEESRRRRRKDMKLAS
jgi:small subunit ribosomal protein S21